MLSWTGRRAAAVSASSASAASRSRTRSRSRSRSVMAAAEPSRRHLVHEAARLTPRRAPPQNGGEQPDLHEPCPIGRYDNPIQLRRSAARVASRSCPIQAIPQAARPPAATADLSGPGLRLRLHGNSQPSAPAHQARDRPGSAAQRARRCCSASYSLERMGSARRCGRPFGRRRPAVQRECREGTRRRPARYGFRVTTTWCRPAGGTTPSSSCSTWGAWTPVDRSG